MRQIASILAIAGLLAAPLAAARPKLDPEAQLAKAVAGRVAQGPVDCIQLNRTDRGSTTIDQTAIVYDQGGTLFVNRFDGGCPQLRWDTFIVTRTPSSQLCRGDTAEVRSQSTPGVSYGACVFGPFTPYKRSK